MKVGKTTHDQLEKEIAAGTISATEPINVALGAAQWATLLRALHTGQLQLGRGAWMAVAKIEAQVGEYEPK